MCFTLFAGDVEDRGASDQTCEKIHVDLVDFGPPDLDHTHVTNVQLSILLVKSNGCDLISQSTSN